MRDYWKKRVVTKKEGKKKREKKKKKKERSVRAKRRQMAQTRIVRAHLMGHSLTQRNSPS